MRICLRKLKIFINLEFFIISHKIQRNRSISVILFVIYFAQIYAILFQPLESLFEKYSYLLVIFNYVFKMMNFDIFQINDSIWTQYFVLVAFIYQVIFFATIIILLLIYSIPSELNDEKRNFEFLALLRQTEFEVTISSYQQQEYVRKSTLIYQLMEMFIAWGVSVYVLLFYHPVLAQSFKLVFVKFNLTKQLGFQDVFYIMIAISTLIFNFVLFYLCEDQNYSYSFKPNDHLRNYISEKPKALTKIFEISIIIITLGTNFNISPQTHIYFNIIILLPLLVLFYHFPKYKNQLINQIQIQILTCFLTLNFCILLFSQLLKTQLTLIVLVGLPLSIQIIDILYQRCKLQSITINYTDDYFNFKMIQIYKQCLEVLGNNGILMKEKQYRMPQNLLIYTFAMNHKINCKQEIDCFCFSYKSDDNQFITRQQFKQYIKDLIRYHYEQYLRRNSSNIQRDTKFTSTTFFYIQYLSEIIKQPTKAFHEMIKFKNFLHQRISSREQMTIKMIEILIKQDFLRMIEIKEIVNQKYDCFKVFNYDKSIHRWKYLFLKALKQLKSWYILLAQNNNMIKALNDGIKLQDLKEELENSIQYLFHKNPYSSECQILILLFQKYINFNNDKIDFPKIDSPQYYKFQNSINGILFHKDAALIYLTLVNVKGIIKNYTRTFREAIGTSDKQIYNQSINNFIPKIIAEVHDIYLDNFVERGRINILKSSNRFLLVKNFSGFIFPILAKVKIETSLPNDFGTSALILPTYLSYHYILLNSYGLIEEISEKLFKQVINSILNVELEQIRQLDCLKLIPRLIKAWRILNQTNEMDKELMNVTQSYLVIPKEQRKQQILASANKQMANSPTEFLKNQDRINSKYFQKLKELYMFKIQFRVIEFITFNGKLHCIEIQTIKSVKKSHRNAIFENLIDKTDYPSLKKKTTKVSLDKKDRAKNLNHIKDNKKNKDSLSHIQYLQIEHQSLCNMETQKLIEDNYMIYQKEFQVHKVNPNYSLDVEETLNIMSQPKETQERKLIDNATSKMKTSTHLNHFNSSNSNVLSQFFSGDQNKILPSSAILEALNDNQEIKSQQSLEVSQSEDNFLNEPDLAYSSGSSKISDLKVKKNFIRSNLFKKREKSKKIFNHINAIIYIVLIFCNILKYYYVIKENNIISQARTTYIASNNFDIWFNHFILCFNESKIQSFNYPDYHEFSAVMFQQILRELQTVSLEIEDQQIPYLQISDTLKFYNVDVFNSFSYYSQYMLAESNNSTEDIFLSLFSRNYLTILQEFRSLNKTILTQRYAKHNLAQDSTNLLVYFSVFAFLALAVFYLLIFLMIKGKRNRILKLFTTFSNQQINSQVESISIILHFCEHIDFENQQLTEQLFDQIKFKIAQSPGMIKIKQQVVSKTKISIVHKNYYLLILYFLTFLFFSFLVSAVNVSALIYQTEFESDMINFFRRLLLYKSTQQYLVEQICYQKFLIKHSYSQKQDILFLNQWDQSLTFMESQLDIFHYFTQKLNDQIQKDYPDGVFQDVIKQNGCLAFDLSSADISPDQMFFNKSICSDLDNVNNGIAIDLVNQYQMLQQFYVLSQQGRNEFTDYLIQPSTLNGFQSLTLSTLYTSHIISLLHDEIAQEFERIISNNFIIHSVLFSLEISICLILIFTTTLKIEQYLYQQLTRVKHLLLLIPLEFLCDNAYVLQFVLSQQDKSEI